MTSTLRDLPPGAPAATLLPPPEATFLYLRRAAGSLVTAMSADEAGERYALAHVAALQATAALLAARARPTKRRSTQRNAWTLVSRVAPEFGEWATYFAAGAGKRAAAESGSRLAVTAREADDLVRDVDRYLALVEAALGLTSHLALTGS